MLRKLTSALAIGLGFAIAQTGGAAAANPHVSLRLEWIKQGQFAGWLVALDKGWFKDEGVDMTLHPAGPDLKPAQTVANGTDQFGIGHPQQMIAARSNEVPLVMVAQFMQDSASVYIAKKSSGIRKFSDIKGHRVGLWFGGDEQEFLAMMNAAGIKRDQVSLIPQKFSITPWLEDQYDVMQVTTFNELISVHDAGYGPDKLVVFRPSDFDVAMINDGIFTTEKMIKEHPKEVQAVVNASLRGWQWTIAHPKEAAKIVLKYNPDLKLGHQEKQIDQVDKLICADPTPTKGLGYTRHKDYEVAQKILVGAKIIQGPVDLNKTYTNRFVENAPAAYKKADCGM